MANAQLTCVVKCRSYSLQYYPELLRPSQNGRKSQPIVRFAKIENRRRRENTVTEPLRPITVQYNQPILQRIPLLQPHTYLTYPLYLPQPQPQMAKLFPPSDTPIPSLHRTQTTEANVAKIGRRSNLSSHLNLEQFRISQPPLTHSLTHSPPQLPSLSISTPYVVIPCLLYYSFTTMETYLIRPSPPPPPSFHLRHLAAAVHTVSNPKGTTKLARQ